MGQEYYNASYESVPSIAVDPANSIALNQDICALSRNESWMAHLTRREELSGSFALSRPANHLYHLTN